ncbi:hypothetical protein C731_4179 [Mycolicibacterium hassiacum DSM 44199]|uniref:EfeO-type cupredoxin-like domain-containing protein n=1 Tax=Mycolicibacterium hassiacum (strain DSM 44199 / CIP 105218 / JCM 12690 / 3849) TaxID=1122247 RepID=K5BIS3_MYCHD|nr:hypothetical protein C731_4179 [Mycolicibacterium hassiacum DSM 44199]MDA4085473.1 hypothetical protein [Mycolicibacterium hassiacum DSM 44199]
MTRLRALPIAVAAVALIAGCGGPSGDEPSASPSASPSTIKPEDMPDHQAPPQRLVVDVTIANGTVTPTNEQLTASVGQPIIFRVTSDADDQLHVHANPEHTFEVAAKPNQAFQFTVEVPGRVDVELHNLNTTIATIDVK